MNLDPMRTKSFAIRVIVLAIVGSLPSLASVGLLASVASAEDVTFTIIPQNMQLIPRDESNLGEIRVVGIVNTTGHTSVRLDVYRSGAPWRSVGSRLIYDNGRAPFDLAIQIPAMLAEFDLRFFLDNTMAASRSQIVCGDVYLINGQSNAQTMGGYSYQNEFVRSFGSSLNAPEAVADTSWGYGQAQTALAHCAVGTWGMEMGRILVEAYGVPILLLNGAVGGTAILSHLRDAGDPMSPNTIYGRLLWRTMRAGVRNHVRAILWHQGESDSDANWSYYGDRFGALWSAWQQDFAPRKVYVFQIHQGCGWDYQSQIREIQRSLPERFENVEVMSTIGVDFHDGCHYAIDGYRQMGRWISSLVAHDFYGESDTLNIRPPNVQRIWFSDAAREELRVRFDGPVEWPADTLGLGLEDYVYLDGVSGAVLEGHVAEGDARTIVLSLNGSSGAGHVTYLPNEYDDLGRVFEGPIIRGPRGIGALSFFEFPIADPAEVAADVRGGGFPRIQVAPNPFLDRAEVRFTLPRAEAVHVEILDAAGRIVRVLADRTLTAGPHALQWRTMPDSRGERLAAGLYFVRCVTGSGIGSCAKAVSLR